MGDLQEKKGLHPKYVMKSGVSPQKLPKYRWQTPIWASICTPVAPSLLSSSGHSPRLRGAQFSFGGHGPGMPPRGAESGNVYTTLPFWQYCSSTKEA